MNPFTPGFNNFNGSNTFPGAFNAMNNFGFPQNFGGQNPWSNWSNGGGFPFGWTGFAPTPTAAPSPTPFWNGAAFNTAPNFNSANSWWMQNAWPTGGWSNATNPGIWSANTAPWANGWSNGFAPAMNFPTGGYNTPTPTPWGGFNPSAFNPTWGANWSSNGFPFFAANTSPGAATTPTTPFATTPWTNGFFNNPFNTSNPFNAGAFNGFNNNWNGFNNNWNAQSTPSTPWSGAPSWFTAAFNANPFNFNWNTPGNFPGFAPGFAPNFAPGMFPGFAPGFSPFGFDREGRANQTPTGHHMHPAAAGANGPISHREAA